MANYMIVLEVDIEYYSPLYSRFIPRYHTQERMGHLPQGDPEPENVPPSSEFAHHQGKDGCLS